MLKAITSVAACVAAIALLCGPGAARAAEGGGGETSWSLLADPENSFSFSIIHGPTAIGHIGLTGWGPNWAWAGISGKGTPEQNGFTVSAPFVVNKAKGQVIQVRLTASKSGPRSIALHYELSAKQDTPLTMLAMTLGFGAEHPGTLRITTDGQERTARLPLPIAGWPKVTRAEFDVPGQGVVAVTSEPVIDLGADHDARFILGQSHFPPGSHEVTLTITFPDNAELLTGARAAQRFTETIAGPDWFVFEPSREQAERRPPSGADVIGMQDWLDKPAGKHGGVRVEGDHFQFEDGGVVKFWGTNLAYGSNCAPQKPIADFTAARFARYGVNAVRLHKFSYPVKANGIGSNNDSTEFDPAALDRFDYFAAQLKKNGVYFGWSHTYGLMVRPGDRDKLVAYDEIMKAFHDGNTYAFINFAPDVQDLLIQMAVNLLKHKNPYTGVTYAKEPALAYVEMQNEDDIFFWTSEKVFNACPTYRKLFCQRFSDWLKAKYGSEAALAKAWEGATKPGESLAERNFTPAVNPWFFSSAHLPQTRGGDRQRLLDSAAFLHAAQNEFYEKYRKALRAAGYDGPLVGSPWQAPAMLPHYDNLRSDELVGYVDRHNYFGGQLNDTMMGQPGGGYISTGLQQTIDRPFGLSEWITVYPSLYSAEGPALVAAYGMGLQGWDASYEFQSQATGRASDTRVGSLPWGVWNADTPNQIGQFPALARMIYRGDVKEGPVISVRRISPRDLAEGKFNFSDDVKQQGDIKQFTGSVSPEALAAGRAVVEFTTAEQPSTFPDMTLYQHGKLITSATKQLAWNYEGKGFVTVNTPGTKAVFGFAGGKPVELGDVRIECQTPYASIFMTALERGKDLVSGKSALISATARNCNTGFSYFAPQKKILENGKSPILIEPVKATIAVGRPIAAVNALDQEGRRTGQTVEVRDGRFTIDEARDKTIYYEVIFR